MFQNALFWKDWPARHKLLGLVPASLFLVSLIYLWFAYFQAPAPTFSWQFIQQQKVEEIPVHQFPLGAFELTVLGDNYLIFEKMLGNPLSPNLTAHYVFVTVLIIAIVLLVSIISLLNRFWYLFGMGLFILLIVGFRFEILQVFGYANKSFTIVVIAVYVLLSFYFNTFRKESSLFFRFFIFSIITIIIGLLIHFYAEVKQPILFLSATGITAGIVISILFIILVAHEIIASFLFILSQGTRQTKSLNHFLIISLIYIVNLTLAYAYKFNMIEWNFLYIDFFLLLTISGLLGVWGFRQQQPQYANIITSDPFGVYLFLCLGAITFGSIGFFIGTANDPAIEIISTIIIYSHLGYGVIFLTYVFSNFVSLLGNNMNVYRVLYRPMNMPYFTFRLAGLIATLGFIFYHTWQAPVRNSSSAYYNAMADIFLSQGDEKLAEGYYQYAATYGFMNHHSNYAIADLGQRKYDIVKEQKFYGRASQRRPSEMSYLNLSNTYERTSSWLDALVVMENASMDFPNSGPILNTTGMLYHEINLIDSSIYYLNKARNNPLTKSSAEINLIAITANANLSVDADSLFQILSSSNLGVKSNTLAFANFQNQKINFELDLSDSTLNLFYASLINNYLLNHLGEVDTTIINRAKYLAGLTINSAYRESILFSSALSYYADGQIKKAFALMKQIIFVSDHPGKYNNILALWSLEQKVPDQAKLYLNYSIGQDYKPANLTKAVALSEARDIQQAILQWDMVRTGGDSTLPFLAEKMIRVLAVTDNLINKLNDEEKYLFCRYRLKASDSLRLKQIITSIENNNYKAKAFFDFSERLYEMDELGAAIQIFNNIGDFEITQERLIQDLKRFELVLLAGQGNFSALANRMIDYEFSSNEKNFQLYLSALISNSKGELTKSQKNFEWLEKANPFFVDAVLASAQFSKRYSDVPLSAYNILTDALHESPESVKLLKAYSIEAKLNGFDEYSANALSRLSEIISPKALRDFVIANQLIFLPSDL